MSQKPKLGAKRGKKFQRWCQRFLTEAATKTEDVFYNAVPLMLVQKRKRHQLPCSNTVNSLFSRIQSVGVPLLSLGPLMIQVPDLEMFALVVRSSG